MNVGNVCINRITSEPIKEWFKTYQKKRDKIKENSKLIDQVSKILEDHENDNLPISISRIGIERMRKMLDRMCDGIEPRAETVGLVCYYLKKIARQ